MRLFGFDELNADVIQSGLCVGCGACVDLCPYFRSYRGRTASLFPCTLPRGKCYAFCPRAEVDLDELSRRFFGHPYSDDPLGTYLSVKIARSLYPAGQASFQAGGTVSALICLALENRDIDVAVLTDREGLLPVPRLITHSNDVFQCASSKYTAAPTLSAFNKAIRKGYRRIGAVATPCQVLGIAQRRMNSLGETDFVDSSALVIGLFCTWAIDFRAFDAYISGRFATGKIKKMDIPPPPAEVMEIYLENEKVELPLNDIRGLIPPGCSYCCDMTAEFSDLSVGVLEGRSEMNTLIIRTKRGEAFVHQAQKRGYLHVEEIPRENLDHLLVAAKNKKKRGLMKIKERGLLNTTETAQHSCLRIIPEVVEKIIR
jgi:coenzyme F420 hydrogenase subunit beta